MKKKPKPVVKSDKKKGGSKPSGKGATFDEIVTALLKVPPQRK
jgi:hypothetical protein